MVGFAKEKLLIERQPEVDRLCDLAGEMWGDDSKRATACQAERNLEHFSNAR
jgi:hypothetical protein